MGETHPPIGLKNSHKWVVWIVSDSLGPSYLVGEIGYVYDPGVWHDEPDIYFPATTKYRPASRFGFVVIGGATQRPTPPGQGQAKI